MHRWLAVVLLGTLGGWLGGGAPAQAQQYYNPAYQLQRFYYYPYYYPYDDAYYGINGSPSYSYQTSAAGADTAVQIALWRRGYYRGPIDGVIGPASRAAIRSFQAGNRIPVTGTVDRSLLQALRVRAPI